MTAAIALGLLIACSEKAPRTDLAAYCEKAADAMCRELDEQPSDADSDIGEADEQTGDSTLDRDDFG